MNTISALGAYCFFENNPKALEGVSHREYKTTLYVLNPNPF